MFQTKKDLKREIAALRVRLALEEQSRMNQGKTDLEPCVSDACIACALYVYREIGPGEYLCGCARNVSCEHFTPIKAAQSI